MSNIDDKVGRRAVVEEEQEIDEPTRRGRARADELRRGRQSNILGVSAEDVNVQRKRLLG